MCSRNVTYLAKSCMSNSTNGVHGTQQSVNSITEKELINHLKDHSIWLKLRHSIAVSQVVSYAIVQHVGQQSEETLLKDNNLAFLLHTQMIAHNNTADILRNLFDTEMNDLSMFDAENIAHILAESPPFAHEDEYTIANITE